MYNIICKFRGVAMRLDIGRVLTHDNYTLEFDCGEDFSARETMDGKPSFRRSPGARNRPYALRRNPPAGEH